MKSFVSALLAGAAVVVAAPALAASNVVTIYLPFESAGRFRSHVIAFAWRYQRQWALVIAPRFLSHLVKEGDFPLGRQVWQDTQVIMPDGAPAAWRNVITSEVLSAGKALSVGDILLSFPVALLMGEGTE